MMKDYIAMTSQSLMSKLNDVARRQYISGALAAVLFIGLYLLATVSGSNAEV
jgi:hypothetical protein